MHSKSALSAVAVSLLLVVLAASPALADDLQVRIDGVLDVRIDGLFPEIRVSVPDIYIGLVRPRPPRVVEHTPPPVPPTLTAPPAAPEAVLITPPPAPLVVMEEREAPDDATELVEEHCIELPAGATERPAFKRAILPPTAPPEIDPTALSRIIGPADTLPPSGTSAVDGDFLAVEAEVLRLVDEVRRRAGVAPLEADPRLAHAAIYHAEEMHRLDYVGHESPVEAHRTLPDRLAASGVREYGIAGENVALTPDSADLARELVRMWMGSPEHRAGLLAPEYRYTGVGIYGAGGRVLAVQVFASEVPAAF